MSPKLNNPIPPKKFQFIAGELCLDFCNTVGGSRASVAKENLHSYNDFVAWAQQAELVDKAESEALIQRATRRASEAADILKRAINLREAIFRVFSAAADGRAPVDADLAQLNRELPSALARLRVAPEKREFVWAWDDPGEPLEKPLGPIARSAAELLTSPYRLERVRACEGDSCGWIFVDGTKNHSRRWCDMRDCGNRAKVRRFRMKQRRAKPKAKTRDGNS